MGMTPITFNPAGARVIDGPRMPLPSGPYKVRVASVEDYAKEGKTSLRFTLEIIEGALAGNSALIHIGTDFTKPANVGNLKLACQSVGIPAASLEAGPVTAREDTFKGKMAYVSVTARETPDGYDDVRFTTAAKFEVLKSALAAAQIAAQQAGQAQGGIQTAGKAPGNSAGTDLSAETWRVTAIGRYQL